MSAATTLSAIAWACGDEMLLPPPHTGEQVFAEPWQAQVFALTVNLNEAGHFTWPEWARTLGARLAASEDPSGADYYLCWSLALVDILEAKGLLTRAELVGMEEQWHSAAARTPHGQPIRLTGEDVS